MDVDDIVEAFSNWRYSNDLLKTNYVLEMNCFPLL